MSRSYHDPCAAARALDLVGERWALLVVRELLLGPKRFRDLCVGLPGVGPNVLSQRLRELEQARVLRRCRVGLPAGVAAYELTERGRDLEPVLIALARWGAGKTSAAGISADALVLALRAAFRPDAAAGLMAWVELRVDVRSDTDRFVVTVADGQLEITRGGLEDPDAVLQAGVEALHPVVLGGEPLADALAGDRLTLTGNRHTAERVLACFHPAPSG